MVSSCGFDLHSPEKLVMSVLVKNVYFDLFHHLVLFLYPGLWLFRKHRVSQILDLSLSLPHPLPTSHCLLLKCLHLMPLVSRFIRPRDLAASHMFSFSPASFTPHSLGCSPIGMSSVTRFLPTFTVRP